MPWLTDLIESLGAAIYVALFLYCVYKSGLLPLFAGVAAQQGYLKSDRFGCQCWRAASWPTSPFSLARRYGIEWAARWPNSIERLSTRER